MLNQSIRAMVVALALAGSVQAAAAEIKALNRIVAEVNGNIITYGEMERAAKTLASSSDMTGVAPAQLLEAAKQSLVERILLVDAATKENLRVSEAQIDNELNRRAALNRTTVPALYQQAARLGFSQKNYRIEVAKDLLMEHMQAKILDDINVSDTDINNYINKAQQNGTPLPQGSPYTVYTIRRIVLNVNKNNTDTAVGNRMRQIVTAVQQGADFGEMAKRFSQEAAAANGGIQEVTEHSEPQRVAHFLKTMNVNEATVPIQGSQNWQVFQLLGKRTETNPDKIQREAVRVRLLRQEQQKAQQQFVGQLQQNMVIREY
ncbi:peptidylprolyl isomerase [Alysiella filiformis]|uniref:PPIC-type PPIASE domain-containing protein n=1 Tax=Alysiella filiformis DSM 16848 TaxID=1120981 RepID=A0A286E9M1_9NEIS|nr:SurA N-terminal domain-containing protein [Alysiella filiformis]QMT31400.1 SurA N-terminal domain-containing protein [Alysiella filiformis]UBQ55589.1 SurA N-terminal domain-containing protein [Alysiella filiformis DSM 16848]SOD67579.1 PPIC-type PPIASE domain-containing protein [Alysiella filiformis DSM 16848]